MPTEWQHKAACELLGAEPIELPSGHCPHVSRPNVLADALERVRKPMNVPPYKSAALRRLDEKGLTRPTSFGGNAVKKRTTNEH